MRSKSRPKGLKRGYSLFLFFKGSNPLPHTYLRMTIGRFRLGRCVLFLFLNTKFGVTFFLFFLNDKGFVLYSRPTSRAIHVFTYHMSQNLMGLLQLLLSTHTSVSRNLIFIVVLLKSQKIYDF